MTRYNPADAALSLLLRARRILDAITEWSTEQAEHADAEAERGSYSTEFIVVVAAVVLFAVAVIAIIAKKVTDKANELNF